MDDPMRHLARRRIPGEPDAAQPLLAGLLKGLSNTGVSVLYCGPDLRFRWAQNLSPTWSRGDITRLALSDFLPPEPAALLNRAQQTAVATGKRQILSVCLPETVESRWFDVTEQKWRETTLRTLLREVAHRSKNMLAMVQSIANQTGRHSDTIETFMLRFRGRIQSLATTQDLVTSSNWRGADLADLVQDQVRRYVDDPVRAVRFEGDRPYLNPNASIHIGLALHELVVNSVSFGALPRTDGSVSVEARRTTGEAEPGLVLTWSEPISIGSQDIGRKRFGSVALERIVPASLNGEAVLSISSERLDYRLTIPAGNFEFE
jgi:two-component sensor histidine kinase